MLDKFIFSLSIKNFVLCLLPKGSDMLHKKIATLAKQEILAILKENENYYKTDFSTERLELSIARLKSGMQKESLHSTATTYITTMLNLFNERNSQLQSISALFTQSINHILVLDGEISDPRIYSAVEKLHENYIYTSSSINNQILLENILNDTSGWTQKLRNPIVFDGIEDAIENIILDVLEYFPTLSFIGTTNLICNKHETAAIVDCLTSKVIQQGVTQRELIDRITTGLKLHEAGNQ